MKHCAVTQSSGSTNNAYDAPKKPYCNCMFCINKNVLSYRPSHLQTPCVLHVWSSAGVPSSRIFWGMVPEVPSPQPLLWCRDNIYFGLKASPLPSHSFFFYSSSAIFLDSWTFHPRNQGWFYFFDQKSPWFLPLSCRNQADWEWLQCNLSCWMSLFGQFLIQTSKHKL